MLIVAGTVIEWGGSENQAIAAVLHDAIEDQPDKMPEGEIRRRFDDEVVEMVLGLSDADVIPKPSWLERKKAYFERLRREPADVVLISVADKLHNARAILSDFVSEATLCGLVSLKATKERCRRSGTSRISWRSMRAGWIAGSHGSFGQRSRSSPEEPSFR